MTTYESIQFRGSPSGEIVQKTFTYHHTDLAPDEAIIKVILSGLCFTDVHMISSDMALGHEGVGIVQAVGSACKTVKVGDRVGWGYPNSSCGSCEICLLGEDSYCPNAEWYGRSNSDTGSLSIAKRKEQWLFKIPDEISSEDAAPMMCGGASVWAPIVNNCKCFDRVGIIGIGGLGHLAIQFLRKMGCAVIVFSRDASKESEAFSLGATEFHCVKDVKNYADLKLSKPIDKMLISTSVKIPFEEFYPVMNVKSAVIPLTVALGDLVAPYTQTVWTGMSITGSSLSPRYEQQKMLEFTARNEIHVMSEKFPMTLEGVNAAFDKLKSGKMRYRGILCWEN
ncbi:GroES-like protein [Dendrothele bispora CBS 962.96]|uniref:GroES-like protein n=1 Tax=Dendrothele bispora (strain CBS 962.96) TaxID=1314807 RepID=A0A4S8LA61_DENBC|nr:GroES-like protein [Dendrothele bispora CBS 962.96]